MKYALPLLLFLLSIATSAKEAPTTIVWPSDDRPVVRFTFGKFVKVGSLASEQSYTVEVTAENLWSKLIPSATFDAYFFDKNNVRIGSGYIGLSNLGVNQKVKFTMPFSATGAQPANLKLQAVQLPKELGPAAPPKKIRLTVYSVPSGARLRVDGEDAGETPKQVEFAVGKHTLQFGHEGYREGSFPLEVGPDDVSGGTISFELGGWASDTVEMRDGSTLVGDVQSMDGTSIVVRVGGRLQSLDRNLVKRILLVQREAPATAAQQ
jgi:PEGA domain